jgi:predicted O-methyltransferase YrrM
VIDKPQQNLEEFARWLSIVREAGVCSYLEIGSKLGGALAAAAYSMPRGSRVVSVDLPWGNKETQAPLEAVIRKLRADAYDARVILGDSTADEVVTRVKALGPFDAIFIDANHTLPYVEADLATYRPMARKLLAFHDINWKTRPEASGKLPIDVPVVWARVREEAKAAGRRYEEICLDKRDNGIGVLWV